MKRFSLALIMMLPLAACTQPAPLEVEDVWTRDTIGGVRNAAIFMTIKSQQTDRLIGASAEIAAKVDLMTMSGGSSAMEMKYLKAIDIPANQAVNLDPSGLHVWLAELKRPLRAGQTFPLTLEFEKAGEHTVTVAVLAPAAVPPTSQR